ncbi:hypothetical protein AVEN_54170-1 [Araneus ventricosus]|uniref:Uncharacterized protein n=1 Tax=Araneus ventricosus TaxID=182803 RepID=A0A4Y2TIR4_ARAVE|nr:hypothetical protein AVEN_54170-1 [Araneus ventricosus]
MSMEGLSFLISTPSPTRPTAFSPLSEQQPTEIRPTSIEVAWPVTASLGVRVIRSAAVFDPLTTEGSQNLSTVVYGGLFTNG